MDNNEFKVGDRVWCAGHINSFNFTCGVESATIVYISKKGYPVVEFDDDWRFDKVEQWPAVFHTKIEALEYDLLGRIRHRERCQSDAFLIDTEIKIIQKEIAEIKAM
jgi:hypothetical protein